MTDWLSVYRQFYCLIKCINFFQKEKKITTVQYVEIKTIMGTKVAVNNAAQLYSFLHSVQLDFDLKFFFYNSYKSIITVPYMIYHNVPLSKYN